MRVRAKTERVITRKYKKEIMLLDKRESEIPKRDEVDPNGEGYVVCKVDAAKLKEWTQPSNVQVMITLNGALYTNLYPIRCISPRIKRMSPRLGLLSGSTTISIVFEGFEMKEDDDTAFTVSVRDTAEDEKQIEAFEQTKDESECPVITFDVSGLSVIGEKVITLQYGDLFNVFGTFLVYDAVKITAVSPKEVGVDGPGKMTLQFSGEIDSQFVDHVFVRIKANEQALMLTAALNEDGNAVEVEWDGEEQSMAAIGAAKKAQIEMSFNEQQWITAKPTVSIK